VAEGDLTSVRQKSRQCGFLEDASLRALKTGDGSITLLGQPFRTAGYPIIR